VPNTHGLTVLVDYAHTEASLKSVMQALKGEQKIILVFGATGDRDNTKRPKMGVVAHELADTIVLTNDDTYTEPSERIINMVKKGIPRSIGDTYQIIPDRREAIKWALRHANK
jgi:UDP-N-acetylmuramoyl-L-alanyl-D-glutamate--2,6-diaminopimelate ligase